MKEGVKAVKIRNQVHAIRHNVMSGYRTLCGKTASFGHPVLNLKSEEITCRGCTDVILAEAGIEEYAERLRKIDEGDCA